MQCELKLLNILESGVKSDAMAKHIGRFMDWDRKELIATIEKFGCSSQESREKIINEFWKRAKK